jgi:hypothetical protein
MKSIFKAIYRTPFEEDKIKALLEPNVEATAVASSIKKIITALEPIEAEIAEATVLPAKAIEPKIVEVEALVPREAETNPLCEEE